MIRSMILVAVSLCMPAAALAQQRVERFELEQAQRSGLSAPSLLSSPVRLAKWTTLTLSAGLAVYGFAVNAKAESRYEELERDCRADPVRCDDRLDSGAFADPALEREYQEVLDMDGRARHALVASQIGLATSVLLFILDLRENEAPPNIPYEPKGLSVRAGPGGVRVGWTLR